VSWTCKPPFVNTGARKCRHDMKGGDERRQRTRESVAEERRAPRDARLGDRTTSWAVSRVHGPTTATIINQNSGAKLTQSRQQFDMIQTPHVLCARLCAALCSAAVVAKIECLCVAQKHGIP